MVGDRDLWWGTGTYGGGQGLMVGGWVALKVVIQKAVPFTVM
ncbi:hypothetical protein SAMN03080599_01874 [Acidaminobacter hydrogenoformans DSM 2784]|uniref:Uncharacterized protein n=1 Tax=Acidaminobacter hydrogenoformans DSM 2784 TaxID=1120920 RepID=A0A1G5S266_9FIRM|nr:hypothetical protein SAMN03080599_01874 [Acidaminobacter hydrogenoformans DSM 2784]